MIQSAKARAWLLRKDRSAVTDLMAILLILESVMLVLIAAWTILRRRPSRRAKPLLLIYTLFSFLWALADIVILLGHANVAVASVVQRGLLYGAFLLALLFLSLTRAFLGRGRGAWLSWLVGLGWLAAALALDTGSLGPGASLRPLALGMLAAGTAVSILAAGALVVQAYRQVRPSLGRGRLAAWMLTVPVLLVGSTLLYAGYIEAGIAVHLIATPLAARALLAQGLTDGRQSLVRALAYLIAIGLALALYVGAFLGVHAVVDAAPSMGSAITGGLIALGIALLFRPSVDLIRQWVRRLLFGGKFDPAQVVQEYGTRVRDATGLKDLSSGLLDTVRRLWDVDRAALFVAHALAESEGAFWLERVDADAEGDEAGRALGTDSPVAHYLEAETHPLTRNEIERAPQFVGMQTDERRWFLEHEVYVALHAQGEWIGLLGLGAKASQGEYLEEDLQLVRRLAEQTGPVLWNVLEIRALEGAQAEIRRAYLALEGRLDHLQKTYDSLETEHRRLAEEDAAKRRFLGAIDDGLRTPFASLDFALQLMEHYGLEGWTRDQRDQLEQLRTEVHKAKQMAENLIALAGLLRGEESLASEELDLEPVIEAALQPLRAQAEAKGVHLAVEIGAPLPLVYGDRRRLSDAVFQLAHNALQFTEANGSIWVRCWGEDDALHVEVQDTGVGVPAEQANSLWERRLVERGTARPGQGLGLGLALVQHVVRAHGGRVYAESEPKVGSTFGFEIPTEAASKTPPAAQEAGLGA